MGSTIIKLIDKKDNNREYYLEWTSITDSPTMYGCSLEEFKNYYKDEYGLRGMEGLEQALERVEKTGTSSRMMSLESIIDCNHAGDRVGKLSLEKILDKYCRNAPPNDNIKFEQLSEVSNDSFTTKEMTNILNNRLNDDEKEKFNIWLKLINYEFKKQEISK